MLSPRSLVLSLLLGLQVTGGGSPPVTITGGTCTNQAVTAVSTTGVPTCTTLTSSYTTGLATTAGTLGQFAATTSAALAGVVSDETGSGGGLVFATGPTLASPILTTPVITQTPVAVGSLPTCDGTTANRLSIVNDALTPALGIAVSAGGALTVGVICKNGVGWIVF